MSGYEGAIDGRTTNQGFNDQAPVKEGKIFSGYKSNGEPDGSWWLSQVRKGIEYRKKAAFENMWDDWRKMYRGEFNSNVLPVNVFFKMIRTLVPRVYYRNPSIAVSAAKPGDDHYVLAQVLERLDNRLIVKMKVKQAIKAMVQNGFLYGTGIGKLGYGAEFTPTPDILDTDAPVGKHRHNFEVEYNDLVMPNMPWFLPVHTGSFIVPAGTVDIHSARWVAHWVKRHIDDVKDDPRLKHTGDLNVGKAYFSEILRPDGRPQMEGMIDLVEIRDKKSGKVFILAPYHNTKILYCEDDDMMSEGHFPYFPLVFNADDQFFWGLPDAKILDPQQRELNENRTLMMKHRRLSIVKMLVKRGNMTPDEAAKLTNEDVDPVIFTENDVANVRVLEAANIPQGLITMDALVEKDVQEILGLGANQFGEYAPGSADRSATEASIVNQATQIRMDERRDAVADLLVDLFGQVHPILFERWEGEQVVDIVGPMGLQVWVKFRPEELKHGGYNVSIDPDSTLPETKQMREQKAMQVYAVLSKNPLIDPHKLTAYLLRAFHGAEYDDMMLAPQQAEQLAQEQQARQNAMMGGATGSRQNPMNLQQAAPLLRALQMGRR